MGYRERMWIDRRERDPQSMMGEVASLASITWQNISRPTNLLQREKKTVLRAIFRTSLSVFDGLTVVYKFFNILNVFNVLIIENLSFQIYLSYFK